MKKIKVLSLLMLLASARIFGDQYANPELSLVLSYQALDNFARTIASDRDDVGALQLLSVMKDSIAFDAQAKQQLANVKDGYLTKGTPLDPVKISAQNKLLQARMASLNQNIDAITNGSVNFNDANSANSSAANIVINNPEQANVAAQALIDQNELIIEQALAAYFGLFGQVYAKNGSIVISSKYSQNMPITPKEYAQLVATLKNAASQFGSAVMIKLDLDNAAPASIKDVVKYVGNMAPANASWKSYAAYGAAALAIGAATIAAVAIGSNLQQGKDWNDTSDALAAYNNGMSYVQPGINSANSGVQSAWSSIANSDAVQYMTAQYNALTGKSDAQKIAAASVIANNAVNADPAGVAAVVASVGQAAENLEPKNEKEAVDAEHKAQVAQEILQKLDDAQATGQKVELNAEESDFVMNSALGVTALGVGTVLGAAASSKFPAAQQAFKNFARQAMKPTGKPSMWSQPMQGGSLKPGAQQAAIEKVAAEKAAIENLNRKFAGNPIATELASQKGSIATKYNASNSHAEDMVNIMKQERIGAQNAQQAAAQVAKWSANAQEAKFAAANLGLAGGVAAGVNAAANADFSSSNDSSAYDN